MPQPSLNRLFLVDGSALTYRSYFAFHKAPLISSRGENTGGVYGFLRALLKLIQDEAPEYLAVVFDTPEPTFRHKAFPEYKATRDKMPDDLVAQLPRIQQVLEGMRIPSLALPGYEADDVMGTLARTAEAKGWLTYLVTGDKDFMQLIGPGIKMYNLGRSGEKSEIVGEEAVLAKFGVGPEHVIDVLGLWGDSSDNVPGVPRVGEKTAKELVQEFGDLEAVLENAEQVAKPSIRQSLMDHADQARLSRELVTIDVNVPVEADLDRFRIQEPDQSRMAELCTELEFTSLVPMFTTKSQAAPIEQDYRLIRTEADFQTLLEKLRGCSSFTWDTETTSQYPLTAELVGLSFSWEEGKAWYVPVTTAKDALAFAQTDLLAKPVGPSLDVDKVVAGLKPILEDPAIAKCGQNIKYDMLVLSRYGVDVQGVDFDTMLAAYLLNPSGRQLNLDALALEYLQFKKIPTSQLIGTGKSQTTMADVPVEEVSEYACEDADVTQRLRILLAKQLEEAGMLQLFRDIELPLLSVLAEMERTGVALDVPMLQRISKGMDSQFTDLIQEIYELAGCEFNINSTQQMAQVLFDRLELPVQRRTKTGPSTDMKVLEKLAPMHPLPEKLLEYRQIAKLKSTYVDALPRLINPGTGRVHTSFNQTIAATGRLSSSDPNLQNIPIRTEQGRQIRKAFVPGRPGWVIVDADYSQIELRLVAHLAQDDALLRAFQNDEDIHTGTASLVFGVPMDEVTPELRRRAKEVNFGIIYGISRYGLAQRLEIDADEAAQFIDAYFMQYPGVKHYIDQCILKAREEGYVETLLGRRRYLPDIHSKNRSMREFSERTAINTPIQGTAADMIKLAMIDVHRRMQDQKLTGHMIMQVHDELVFESPEAEVTELTALVKNAMANALPLSVPVKVDVGVGRDWLEAH